MGGSGFRPFMSVCALPAALAMAAPPKASASSAPGALRPDVSPPPPLPHAWNSTILVGTHHKTGTVLLAKVFRVAARLMEVPRSKENKTSSSGACAELFRTRSAGVCIEEHTSERTTATWLTDGTPFLHVVRDPLEMCVSAYQYHLQGTEPWLNLPRAELGSKTLQSWYVERSEREGVAFECTRIMNELVDEALVFNATRGREATLSLFFEDFSADYDREMRRIFDFLDSGDRAAALVKLASQYDLARHSAGDERHVSASEAKQRLRDLLYANPLLSEILTALRVLLGYSNEPWRGRDTLCASLRQLCATTHVGFISWCANGRVMRGKLTSLSECGELASFRGSAPQANHSRKSVGVNRL